LATHLDTKGNNAVPHENTVFHGLLKQIPWGAFDRSVDIHRGDRDPRMVTSKSHLIALLLAQLSGADSLREIETRLASQARLLYHLGARPMSRSSLATANASRSPEIFAELLSSLMARLQAGYRRKIKDCVRLIDSTSVRLNSLSKGWATFSQGVCGAKAHIVYDPDADQPLYLMVTASNVNDITAAKDMPIEAGATYVFDLGYYDYGWWAKLDGAGCRIVTRLKSNTPFTVLEERPVEAGSSILSDRVGLLPKRLAASRRNPMAKPTREIRVQIDTGRTLRIFTNDLEAPASGIADLYKRRWAIELFFRWVKQTLKIKHFPRHVGKRRAHSDHRGADRLPADALGSRGLPDRRVSARLRQAHQGQSHAPPTDRLPARKTADAEYQSMRLQFRNREETRSKFHTGQSFLALPNRPSVRGMKRARQAWARPGHPSREAIGTLAKWA
jgi:hypothetical protein